MLSFINPFFPESQVFLATLLDLCVLFSIMRFTVTLALAAVALTCSAAPTTDKHLLHEKRDGKPHQWERREPALAHQVLPIRIGLRQRNLENADQYIRDVADPNSPNFGKATRNPSSGRGRARRQNDALRTHWVKSSDH
jgi:hypothetical protein